MSEVVFMFLIPYSSRPSHETTLLLGMLAWVCRYLLLLLAMRMSLDSCCSWVSRCMAHATTSFCLRQIYTDSKAGAQHKAAAQGLITLATYVLACSWGSGLPASLTTCTPSAARMTGGPYGCTRPPLRRGVCAVRVDVSQ